MTVLEEIIAGVRADLAVREERLPLAELEKQVEALASTRVVRDGVAALSQPGRVNIIAEVKRSSPSKGALADIPDPAALAAEYEAGGAAAISVLTEQRRFGGSLADLDAVRAVVDIPVQRKDFIVTRYQVLEAYAHGADIILLIIAGLTPKELAELYALSRELGLTVLVEAHDYDEASAAVDLGARVIGVNTRNLKTLEVFPRQFADVMQRGGGAFDHVVRVAESGVSTPDDVAAYAAVGAHAVLIGEALVTGGKPRETVAAMSAATTKGKH